MMELGFETYDKMPDEAMQIRKAVFVEEQGFVDEFDEIDAEALHILLRDNGTPVATCRLYIEEEISPMFLGRFAVIKPYRGKGVGSEMLRLAELYAHGHGGREIRLHSQYVAKDFYEKNGYEACSGIEDEQGAPHVWMRKSIWTPFD